MLFDVGYGDPFFFCLMLVCRFFVLFDVGMEIVCAV